VGLVSVALLGATCLGSMPAPAQAQPGAQPTAVNYARMNPVTKLTDSTFADPPQNDMPWARWNFAPATATIAGLEADLQDAYDHNIAGVEIGQGGVPTKEQLTAIYNKANALGMKVSLKVASALPDQTFTQTDDNARRTLGQYRLTVAAGATINVDLPGPASGNPGTIVAALAYRCSDATCPTQGRIKLERDSVIDLTGTLTATNTDGYNDGSTTGHLTWTAPASPAGEWAVITFRAIPFGTTPETLNPAGTKLLTDAYDAYFAGGLGTLVKANGGDFFVDSHAGDPWGAPEELWSSNMKSEFQARTGYDITKNLAALIDPTMTGGGFSGVIPDSQVRYLFSDGSADKIRSDFNKVRSDLYTANRLVAFQTWSHTYNMALRLQQEDGPFTSIGDQLQTSAVLDRSEYESLTGSDQADIYRPMASALHMTGNSWYSTECCAVLNGSYLETYQDAIIRMNKEFAGGVNRIVYHIRPYVDKPTTTWPGAGFSDGSKVGFANAWNRTQPYWQDAAAMNDYFARSHMVLTQGQAKIDVAVYMRNYSSPAAFATTDASNRHWQDTSLQRAGYTWDYLDESLFNLPNAKVTGHKLAEGGPGYKALVFDQYLYPTTNTARGSLTIDAAKKILSYARSGLPVIFVGKPTNTGSLTTQDSELSTIVAKILSLHNVYQVKTEADVPAKLARIGVNPNAKPAESSSLLSVRRWDASTHTNYYWLYNQGVDTPGASTSVYGKNPSNLYEAPETCTATGNNPCMQTGSAVSTEVSLIGKGEPYLLDAFSGKITPITDYTRKGDKVTVTIDLATDASTIVAISTKSSRFGINTMGTRILSTTADSSQRVGNTLMITDDSAGTYKARLSNGKTVFAKIGDVPDVIDLTAATWKLEATDWQPTNPYGTVGEDGTRTTKAPVSVTLGGLKSWPNIPELKDASGTGVYTTTVTLPATWDASHGATISLGQVTDTFTLTVNGHTTQVDQVSATADISPYLKAGANTVTVTVATTLNNRLFALDTAVKNRGVIQQSGLVGPVVVSPYRTATIWKK
jgi:hypothetical protein